MTRGVLGAVAVAAGMLLTGLHANQAMARDPVIVAFGDSLTAGFGLPQNETFPAQLERALKARGQDVKVVNAGVSGDTSAAGLARLDRALPDDASAAIIEFGINDASRGLDPAATKATLEKIIMQVKARGLPILLAGMELPKGISHHQNVEEPDLRGLRNLGKEYVDSFRALYEDLAARYDLILYPFFLDGVILNDKYTASDGLHPNKGLLSG